MGNGSAEQEAALQSPAYIMAMKFDAVVEEMCGTEIDVSCVSSAIGALLGQYFSEMPPNDRITALSATVDTIIATMHANFETDLSIKH